MAKRKAVISAITCVLVILLFTAISQAGEIHQAIEQGNYVKVKSLLDRYPSSVNARDSKGDTPLHYAAWEGHRDIVVLLVARGANISAKDKDGDTPLHSAALKGRTGVVKLLLSYGAYVNARNYKGRTPLYLAELRNYWETARVLRQFGGVK